MLSAADRAALRALGIGADLRVTCFFTKALAGSPWEKGVVTRLEGEALFVAYDGDEWPVPVLMSCRPVGNTWRPGWVDPDRPPAAPKKKQKARSTGRGAEQAKRRLVMTDGGAGAAAAAAPASGRASGRARPRVVYTEQSEESSDEDSLITLARAPATTSEDSEDEPPADEDWETEHRWMHARCAREFDGRVISAKVIRWLPASGSDPALWKIRHADGDEEDLEEAELRDALRLHAARAAPKQRRAKPAARRTAAPPAAAPPQVIPPVPSLFARFRSHLAHFFPVFSRFLRVFTVSTRRFQRAPSRNPWPRNSRHDPAGGLRFSPSAPMGRITWILRIHTSQRAKDREPAHILSISKGCTPKVLLKDGTSR